MNQMQSPWRSSKVIPSELLINHVYPSSGRVDGCRERKREGEGTPADSTFVTYLLVIPPPPPSRLVEFFLRQTFGERGKSITIPHMTQLNQVSSRASSTASQPASNSTQELTCVCLNSCPKRESIKRSWIGWRDAQWWSSQSLLSLHFDPNCAFRRHLTAENRKDVEVIFNLFLDKVYLLLLQCHTQEDVSSGFVISLWISSILWFTSEEMWLEIHSPNKTEICIKSDPFFCDPHLLLLCAINNIIRSE